MLICYNFSLSLSLFFCKDVKQNVITNLLMIFCWIIIDISLCPSLSLSLSIVSELEMIFLLCSSLFIDISIALFSIRLLLYFPIRILFLFFCPSLSFYLYLSFYRSIIGCSVKFQWHYILHHPKAFIIYVIATVSAFCDCSIALAHKHITVHNNNPYGCWKLEE